jgi:quercetin dioxygenase-like cupin family protein
LAWLLTQKPWIFRFLARPSWLNQGQFMKTKTNLLVGAAALLVLAGSGLDARAVESDDASKIKVTRMGLQPSREGPAEYFTGSVRVDPLFETGEKTNKSAAYVSFQPGARSAWHTHPNGQILIVTSGTGRVQRWGDPVQEIRSGDVVWIPPGQKHWHGASPTSAMTHIAIQDAVDGNNGLDGKSQRRAISDETTLKNRSATGRRSDGLRANQATQCPGPETLAR